MTQEQLNTLLNLIRNTSNQAEDNELSATILQMAADSIALDKLKTIIPSATTAPSGNLANNENGQSLQSENTRSQNIIFTKQEVSRMDKTFKKHFILNGYVAHVIKRPSGKNGFYYEIRYRRNGYNIYAASTDINEAKLIFLEKTLPENIGKYLVVRQKTGFNLLEEIFAEWYQYKKGTLCEKEHKRFEVNFNGLPETLRKKPINTIRTVDIDAVMKEVKPRKYEELRTLFNGIFKYAVASGIIQHNPVALIKFKRAERQTRDALPKDEIITFLTRLNHSKYDDIRQAMYLLYFFGLRPCEVDEEAHREENFLIVRNRKRKNGKIEYKKIPIPTQAEDLIDWEKPLTFQTASKYAQDELIKDLLNGKTGYYLRHTFSTLCQQYVRPDIVDIWMGDSPQRLVGKVYTHFPDDFMYEQMQMVKFPLPQMA